MREQSGYMGAAIYLHFAQPQINFKHMKLKQVLPAILLLCVAIPVQAQFYESFGFRHTVPCPFDESSTIVKYQGWIMYQTLGNYWDSEIDSSRCISLREVNGIWGIDLADVDLSRPIYVRATDIDLLLDPNSLYQTEGGVEVPEGILVNTSDTCIGGYCSGLILQITPFTDSGEALPPRTYDITDQFSFSNWYYFQSCLPTEYFQANIVTELIFKISLDASIELEDNVLNMGYARIEQNWLIAEVESLHIPDWTYQDSTYELNINEAVEDPWSSNLLLKYGDESTIPSNDNIYFVEATPMPNPASQRTINIYIDEYTTFIPQPFTAIRGSLVKGQDSLRHITNIINDGGSFCYISIADFVFEDQTSFIHKSGGLHFSGPSGCMMFRKGSAFKIAEEASLHFGNSGNGILALQQGSKLELGRNSELIIDNLLWLQGRNKSNGQVEDFRVELKPGMRLSFGESGRLYSTPYDNGRAKLRVFMHGGILDDSNLSAEERTLIERVYPEAEARFADNFQVFPNPNSGSSHLNYIAPASGTLKAALRSLDGKALQHFEWEVEQGLNQFELHLPYSIPGIYFLELQDGNKSHTLKLIKV